MTHLHVLVEQQVRRHLNVSEEEFEYLTHPSPNQLHDPFYYKDMRELVMELRKVKQKQEKDPHYLLAVRSDYDTDGVCAAAILTAALDVFGFHFYVYIPTMEEGYGISPHSIDFMKQQMETNGDYIGTILTADNGITAFSGVSYAKSLGMEVLITDHHPAATKLPDAKAAVDPCQPKDLYPFKGNSGGCVAWKAMLAYADLFEKEKKPLIERLIVFAGISNLGDVMPMRGENRYTVTAAMDEIRSLVSDNHANNPDYKKMADTPYLKYNTVFHGLYDLITMLQEAKDEERVKKGKKPVPLPWNEELISWYLSPLLNAPRRVHETCLEALSVFLVSDRKTRQAVIRRLIELNKEKSVLKANVMQALKPDEKPLVLCANTRKGISGLIAADLAQRSHMPAVVFSYDNPDDKTVIYQTPPEAEKITGSARSYPEYPLHRILEKMNEKRPGIVTGAGHATAAGFSIRPKDYEEFCKLFQNILPEVWEEVQKEAEIVTVPANAVILEVTPNGVKAHYTIKNEAGEIENASEELDTKTFAHDAMETDCFLERLRPFGDSFMEKTRIDLIFDHAVYRMGWKPDFWQTFKFSLYGVDCLTFDIEWAKEVKSMLAGRKLVYAEGMIRQNEFRGKITPQLILTPKKD